MKSSLFVPTQIKLPPALILAPVFPDLGLLEELEDEALKKATLLNSTLLTFESHALLCGFMGYPHLLTLLEFIAGVRRKEIYFLGLAGSLAERFNRPQAVNVSAIHASAVYRVFSREQSFPLTPLAAAGVARAPAVSVDIIQRETRSWLNQQLKRKIALVEMELFPLRVFLGRPFTALVVVSDRVTERGIVPFADRRGLAKEFGRVLRLIRRRIEHG